MIKAIRTRLAIRRRMAEWAITYRQGTRPNLAIFALRRGGSTLLADMLSSERGMMMVNEPFFVREGNPDYALKTRWLRPRLHNELFGLDDDDRARVRGYLSALLAGKLPMGVCRNPKFPFRADRMLLKVLHAAAIIDWIAESFGLQVVRLLRHPAPQAVSVLRHGWAFPAEAILARPDFVCGFLADDQVEFGLRILSEGVPWQKAILDWCLQHHFMVHLTRTPSLLITYEELTLDPAETCRSLCEQFQLSDYERITERMRRPSSSPGGCSVDNLSLIQSGDSWSLIQSWRRHVDASMVHQGQEILDRFGVTMYAMNHPLPLDRPAGTGDGREGQHALADQEAAAC